MSITAANAAVKNSTADSSGSRAFGIHNYIGDLDKSKQPAVKARLHFDIFNSRNTFMASRVNPICYGFADAAEAFFLKKGIRLIRNQFVVNGAHFSGRVMK